MSCQAMRRSNALWEVTTVSIIVVGWEAQDGVKSMPLRFQRCLSRGTFPSECVLLFSRHFFFDPGLLAAQPTLWSAQCQNATFLFYPTRTTNNPLPVMAVLNPVYCDRGTLPFQQRYKPNRNLRATNPCLSIVASCCS